MTALPSTKTVRSSSERTSTFPICGRRYGGSSSANEAGIPLSTVPDRIRDHKNVSAAPKTIIPVSIAALTAPDAPAAKNTAISVISAGNLPLQGIKLLVSTAMSRSLGESIILHPVMPAALQPSPIAIVSACFPHALERLKYLSRLNAARGR